MAIKQDVKVQIGLKDDISKGLSNISKKVDQTNKSFSGLSKVLSVGLKVGIGGAIAGITALGGVLVTSIKKASEAETEMAKVNALLKNATEKTGLSFEELSKQTAEVSKSMIRLGFDDEATSLTFAKFTQITGDTAKAQEWLQATLDWSRLKSIDLETATTQMVMAMENGGRVANQLGIDIAETATSTEVLSEIQKQVSGQSEAYANTLAGQMSAFKVQWENLMELLGDQFLPMVTNVLKQVNDKLQSIDWEAVKKKVYDFIDQVKAKFEELKVKIQEVTVWFKEHQAVIEYLSTVTIVFLIAQLGKLSIAFSITLYSAITKVIGAFVALNATLLPYFLVGGCIYLLYKFFDFVSKKVTGFPLIDQIKSAIIILKENIQFLIDTWNRFWESFKKERDEVKSAGNDGGGTSSWGGDGKAVGGLVTPNRSYLVGERGAEMFTPATTGTIVPNGSLSTASAPITLNVNVGVYAGTETEKRNVAEDLYKGLVQLAGMQNKSVAQLLGA